VLCFCFIVKPHLYDILPDDITINKTREIVYEVTNSGSVATTYDVRIMDDFSSAVPPVRDQYNISAGDRVNGTFTLLQYHTDVA
jgi:hypothetical protein